MKEGKLKEKLCKNCGSKFKQFNSLQNVCSVECSIQRAKKLTEKENEGKMKKKLQTMKIQSHSKKYKKALQAEINKLSRLIDAKFGLKCIDCGGDYGKQVDAAHFHSVGSNNSTRYNLHNVHSAKSNCNQYSSEHKSGYRMGIINRYGEDYMALIDSLPLKYDYIKLTPAEVYEKLSLVRKIVRTFDTYQLSSPTAARELFNKIIGIYHD